MEENGVTEVKKVNVSSFNLQTKKRYVQFLIPTKLHASESTVLIIFNLPMLQAQYSLYITNIITE